MSKSLLKVINRYAVTGIMYFVDNIQAKDETIRRTHHTGIGAENTNILAPGPYHDVADLHV